MPIKYLNTFSKNWTIKARVSSKGRKITTKSGISMLKIELIDDQNTRIEGIFFGETADNFDS